MKHTKQFFLTHLYFRESLVLATPEEYESNLYLNFPLRFDGFQDFADSVKCWFEIYDGRRCRSVNLSQFSKMPLLVPQRLIALMFFCLYNGGLQNLSYDDLSYIYYQIRAYGKKYYS